MDGVGEHAQVVRKGIKHLSSLLRDEAMPAGIVSHVVVNSDVVGGMDNNAALLAVCNTVLAANNSRHIPQNVEMQRIPSQETLLAKQVKLNSLNVLGRVGGHEDDEMPT